MDKAKICVVTGSRAEYGLLRPLLAALKHDDRFELQVLVTGMHLSADHGYTYRTIEEDGFQVSARIDCLVEGDSAESTARSMARGLAAAPAVFAELKPDMLVVLGDRFEIFAIAQAAMISRIPIAHIAGGDISEGAFDDAIRHCLTKMAHVHLVTNTRSAQRVRQMGEEPRRIFVIGNPAEDFLNSTKLVARDELEQRLDFRFRSRNLLITFHPVTLASDNGISQLEQMLIALDRLGDEVGLLFTSPNADPAGIQMRETIERFIAGRPNAKIWTAMGQLLYMSTMQQADAVVGNSSSGLYEAPLLGKPTVNIGNRQLGRFQAPSILDCEPQADAIERTIRSAFGKSFEPVRSGSGAAQKSVEAIAQWVKDPAVLQKRFTDVESTR